MTKRWVVQRIKDGLFYKNTYNFAQWDDLNSAKVFAQAGKAKAVISYLGMKKTAVVREVELILPDGSSCWLEWFFRNFPCGATAVDAMAMMVDEYEKTTGKVVPVEWRTQDA